MMFQMISFLVFNLVTSPCHTQSIGYGLPNFGLQYNPYTSSAWGYGLGPQYSTLRGSMAASLLYGNTNPYMGHSSSLMNQMLGITGQLPFGPYSQFAYPALGQGNQYHTLGPYGRYPGSTGTYQQPGGYDVYTGMRPYSGFGGFPSNHRSSMGLPDPTGSIGSGLSGSIGSGLTGSGSGLSSAISSFSSSSSDSINRDISSEVDVNESNERNQNDRDE